MYRPLYMILLRHDPKLRPSFTPQSVGFYREGYWDLEAMYCECLKNRFFSLFKCRLIHVRTNLNRIFCIYVFKTSNKIFVHCLGHSKWQLYKLGLGDRTIEWSYRRAWNIYPQNNKETIVMSWETGWYYYISSITWFSSLGSCKGVSLQLIYMRLWVFSTFVLHMSQHILTKARVFHNLPIMEGHLRSGIHCNLPPCVVWVIIVVFADLLYIKILQLQSHLNFGAFMQRLDIGMSIDRL